MDDELIALMAAPPDRPLDQLEAQVWLKVAERRRARAAARQRVSAQGFILILALIASIGVGIKASHGLMPSTDSDELALALNLAPSHLLLSQSR